MDVQYRFNFPHFTTISSMSKSQLIPFDLDVCGNRVAFLVIFSTLKIALGNYSHSSITKIYSDMMVVIEMITRWCRVTSFYPIIILADKSISHGI